MLNQIGFYTLSDDRARNVSGTSPLMRCELILTDACNFRCPYCRKLDDGGVLPLEKAKETVLLWASEGLRNVRFSGGEPTVYPGLLELVRYTKALGVERIAISTNGSASLDYYQRLIDAGVNDFSISLDACCAAYGDKIAGVVGSWEKVVQNIRNLSRLTYVTLGIVVTEETVGDLLETVRFADSLGPADIRIISAAQYNQILAAALELPDDLLDRYPILRYRIENLKKGRNVRGLSETDSRRCSLVLDDMAVNGGKHFPCIIYMREGGRAIGPMGPDARKERERWFREHDTHQDPICKANCLDVCIDHNNCVQRFRAERAELPQISAGTPRRRCGTGSWSAHGPRAATTSSTTPRSTQPSASSETVVRPTSRPT